MIRNNNLCIVVDLDVCGGLWGRVVGGGCPTCYKRPISITQNEWYQTRGKILMMGWLVVQCVDGLCVIELVFFFAFNYG